MAWNQKLASLLEWFMRSWMIRINLGICFLLPTNECIKWKGRMVWDIFQLIDMFPRTSNGEKQVDLFLANLNTVDMFLPAIIRTGTKNNYLFHFLEPPCITELIGIHSRGWTDVRIVWQHILVQPLSLFQGGFTGGFKRGFKSRMNRVIVSNTWT